MVSFGMFWSIREANGEYQAFLLRSLCNGTRAGRREEEHWELEGIKKFSIVGGEDFRIYLCNYPANTVHWTTLIYTLYASIYHGRSIVCRAREYRAIRTSRKGESQSTTTRI